MRRNLNPRIITAGVALVLLASTAASAQFDDDPFFERDENIHTTVVLNATSGDAINATIDSAARKAHRELGGKISDGNKNAYFIFSEPDRTSVVIQADAEAGDLANVGRNLMFISGGDSEVTARRASRNPNTSFVDLGQSLPCLDAEGQPDDSGECTADSDVLPFNYSAVTFDVHDPAYLAGVVAASASRDDRLGIISGMADCEECNRYVQGFVTGARSVEPDIEIQLAYLADDSESLAFGDATAANTFADAFIEVYQPDVLLPIAHGASVGMIQAACDHGILAVGTDMDVSRVHPELSECILGSITRDVETAVRHSVYDYSTSRLPRLREMSLADGYVDLTDEWSSMSALPGDVSERYEDARTALLTGAADACPVDCGKPFSLDGSAAAEADPGGGEEETPQATEVPEGG